MKILKNLSKNIDVILLSLVICINCLRVILGLGETTLILYALYFLCALELFVLYGKKFSLLLKKDKTIKSIFVVILLMVLYATISLAWIPSNDVFSTYLKFLLSLCIGIIAVAMPIKKIKGVINYVIIINVVYAGALLINPGMADVAMGAGLNYLNATLPLGLALTMTLTKSLNSISNKGGLLWGIVWIILSGLFFVSLMRFAARGVLLFPPLIAVFVFLSMKKTHKIISWLLIPLFLGFLYLFYDYYMANASDYALNRMMNLMELSEEEDRWDLWSKSIGETVDRFWFIFGGGMEAFRYNSIIHYYPHNIFIQIIGEFGLLGIIITIMILWNVVGGFVRSRVEANNVGVSDVLYCVIGAFAYYILTFSKSFSLYDGLPLFVIIAFCFSLYYHLLNARSNRSLNIQIS